MAETHELRLKIDAGAAQEGSRQFSAALNAVKAAVRGLERDSSGAFTKINKSMKDLGALGKIKIAGVDARSIQSLEAFAVAQTNVVKTATTSSKAMSSLVRTIVLLAEGYATGRKGSDLFTASITRTNNALTRQIALAQQARTAVNQVGRGPAAATVKTAGAAPVDTAGVSALTRLIVGLSAEYKRMGVSGTTAGNSAKAGMDAAAKAASAAAAAQAKQASIQLSVSSAMRRAEMDAARLSDKLASLGDTAGVNRLQAALGTLRAALSGNVSSVAQLRSAVDVFNTATTQMKTGIIAVDGAQRRATSATREQDKQQRQLASSARQVEQEMRSIAGAANAADAAFRKATGGMRGLENTFSGTFQAGTLFRNLLGSLTLGTFTRSVFEAGNSLDQFAVTMKVATGSFAGAQAEMAFLDGMTRSLGTDLTSARDSYSKFAISSSLAGVAASDTREIFSSVSMALSVLGKGTEDQNLAFLALEQMMSKGTLSSEELRRQLGERLPGAVNLMAKALGVTTIELNKMLKAGSIQSADALPKFAAEIRKEFGPGLLDATKRAGFALGTVRGEIQRLMESTANSGFMQVLATDFGKLTTVLQSPEVYDAARKLGDGFAAGAEMAGDAMIYIATHINELGEVAKNIVGGMLIRQFALGGAAAIAFAQRGVVAIASVTDFFTGQTAGASAADRHTLAIQNNTRAMIANAAASSGGAVGVAGLAAAQSGAALGGTAGGVARVGGVLGGIGSIASGAGKALGLVTRVLGFLGPAAFAASIAFSVLPMIFSDTKTEADRFADGLNEALRRAGVSFDTFKDKAVVSTASINFSYMVADLSTFDQAMTSFISDQTNKLNGFSAIVAGISPAGISTSLPLMPKTADEQGLEALGVTVEQLNSLQGASRTAVSDLAQQTSSAIYLGQSILQIRDNLESTINIRPDTKAVLQPILDSVNVLAQAEVGVANKRDQIVASFGSANDKMVQGFVEQAAQVVATGVGMTELHAKTVEAGKTNIALAATYTKIELAAKAARIAGTTSWTFKETQQGTYDSTAVQIDSAKAAEVLAQKDLNTATEDYNTLLQDSQNGLRIIQQIMNEVSSIPLAPGIPNPDAGAGDRFREAAESFERFNDAGIVSGSVISILQGINAVNPPTTSMQAFTTEVTRQYNALKPAEQTYLGLQRVLNGLVSTRAYANMGAYSAQISATTRQTMGLELSAQDLHAEVNNLTNSTTKYGAGVLATTGAVVTAATKVDALRGVAAAASDFFSGVLAKLQAMADAAMALAARMEGIRNSFANMFSMGATFQTSMADMAATDNQEAMLKGLLPEERAFKTRALKIEEAARASADEINKAYASGIANTTTNSPTRVGLADARDEALSRNAAATAAALAAARNNAYTETNNGPDAGGGGSGPATDMEKYNDKLEDKIALLNGENAVLQNLGTTYFATADAATMYAKAMAAGGGQVDAATDAMIRQYDAAAKLNDQLTRLAKDPLKDWLDGIPMWTEGARTMEAGTIGSLSSALSDYYQTGKTDGKAWADSMKKMFADILADQSIKMVMNMLNYKSSKIRTPQLGTSEVATGGVAAGNSIGTAMLTAGQQVAAMFRSALGIGGRTAGVAVRTGVASGGVTAAAAQRSAGVATAGAMRAGVASGARAGAPVLATGVVSGAAQAAPILAGASGGSAGGGMGKAVGSFLLSMFGLSEGGYSDRPSLHPVSAPAAAFHNAPHYAQGTPNTSGIPAILHPNEAVIPLSKGRKVPIEMPEGTTTPSGNLTSVSFGDINVSVEMQGGADNSAEAAKAAGRIAELIKASVAEQMASAMAYGGQFNPRGR